MTIWSKAALAYEAHLAELELARNQYREAAEQTLRRLTDSLRVELGEAVGFDDSEKAEGIGKGGAYWSRHLEDVEIATVHGWVSGAYGGAPGTLAVVVEAKELTVPALGWGRGRLRELASQSLHWPTPELTAPGNADLDAVEMASNTLCVHRIPLDAEEPIADASKVFRRLVEESAVLAEAVRTGAARAWTTYGAICDAMVVLAAEGDVRKRGAPEPWKGRSFVTLSRGTTKLWVSVSPTGQLAVSVGTGGGTIDASLAAREGWTLGEIQGATTAFVPEGEVERGREHMRNVVVSAVRACLG